MTAAKNLAEQNLPAHLSVSQYTTYLSCPRQYGLERVAKVPQSPACYFLGGTSFHEATEFYDLQVWEGNEVPTEAVVELALKIFERLYAENLEKEPDVTKWRKGGRVSKEWPDKETPDFYRAKLPGWIEAYVEWRTRPGAEQWLTLPGGEPAIETSFSIELGTPFKGAPDRIAVTQDGMVGVLDLKTGSSTPDSPFQLGVYAIVMEQLFGIRPTWGAYYKARDGKLTTPIPLDNYNREWVAAALRDVDTARMQGLFPPKPSNRCGSCSVNRYCSAYGGDLAHTVDL